MKEDLTAFISAERLILSPPFYKWKAIYPSLIQYTQLKSMRALYKEQG